MLAAGGYVDIAATTQQFGGTRSIDLLRERCDSGLESGAHEPRSYSARNASVGWMRSPHLAGSTVASTPTSIMSAEIASTVHPPASSRIDQVTIHVAEFQARLPAACSGDSPPRTRSAVRSSTCRRNSSAISDSTSAPRRMPRQSERTRALRPRMSDLLRRHGERQLVHMLSYVV